MAILDKSEKRAFSIFKIFPLNIKIIFILIMVLNILFFAIDYIIPLTQKNFINYSIKIKNIYNKYLFNIIFFYILIIIIGFIIKLLDNKIKISINKFFYRITFNKTFNKNYFDFKKKGASYYENIIYNDSKNASLLFQSQSFNFIFNFIQSIFILFLIYKWNKLIFLLFIIPSISGFLFLFNKFNLFEKKYSFIRNSNTSRAEFSGEILKNNTSIKIYTICYDYLKKYFNIIKHSVIKLKSYNFKLHILNNYFFNLFKYLFFSLILFISIKLILQKKLNYGQLIAIISYYNLMFKSFNNFEFFLGNLRYSEYSINSILSNVFDNKFLFNNSYKQLEEKIILEDKINSLNFNNVSIFYKIEDKNNKDNNNFEKNNIKYVIRDFNLEIKDSKKIAIVGLSGEGKTSILKVLYKQSNNYENKIIINNNIDLKLIPLLNYYYHINVFSQETEILNRTLKENLIFNKTLIKLNDSDKIKREIKEKVQKVIIKLKNIIANNKSILQTNFDQYKDVLLENREVIKSGKNIIYNKIIKKTINLIKKIVKQDEDIENYFLSTGFISDKIESNNIYLFYYFKKLLFENRLEKMIEDYIFNLKYVFEEDYEEVIERLELKKLEGREFGEDGAFISGGERQRIVFGRFLLKKNYDLFVFDEPFTSLDILAEEKLLQIAKEKLKNKMGIIISHKLNILKELADEFIVIDKGKVVDRGTHNDLINKEGLYKKLFDKFAKQRKVIENSQI